MIEPMYKSDNEMPGVAILFINILLYLISYISAVLSFGKKVSKYFLIKEA
jgi:hypothetical protein